MSSNSNHRFIHLRTHLHVYIKAKRCSFCCLRERHGGKQHQKKRGDVDSLSRKTWRWFEKKRSMFLLLQISHLDNKNVWFLCKSLIFLCYYINGVLLYSFVKIVSQFKNDFLLLRNLHKKWVTMLFLKLLKRSLMIIYLFINCFGLFINFRFHANFLKMNNYIYNPY